MPKRTDLRKILVIGSGPIVIGQACEFDYSGTQAIRALQEEGYEVILVNSNPATIMTDPELADRVYIEPLTPEFVERVIAQERPDALLPTMGGQTALNLTMALHRLGVLERYGVELLGAQPEVIHRAEDRETFKRVMESIGCQVARSSVARSLEDGRRLIAELGLPLILRPSFTLGGEGGGTAFTESDFLQKLERALFLSPTHDVLVEESLLGWKEFELEVVRDRADNCVIVCSIENFDPMGVHTGDSITVAPAQTLTDREFQILRDQSLAIIRAIGVETGGSNIQFAVHPETGRVIVIEMNPRVSRSSALASKATGFPIARIAAKLAVGYRLDELSNDITGTTPASFEPSLDYVVVKIPRFDFDKFRPSPPTLTTQMKSVGEVMALGRTFEEALGKALAGLEVSTPWLTPLARHTQLPELLRSWSLEQLISQPTPYRIYAIADAIRAGRSIDEIHTLSRVDRWFLRRIAHHLEPERELERQFTAQRQPTGELLRELKERGWSDRGIAGVCGVDELTVASWREQSGVRPSFLSVDTCAAEFEARTPYHYSSYRGTNEVRASSRRKVMILGGGPNRIGQGIEFDYCCVHAAQALRQAGIETLMVNSNPETVSTDYDTSDRLYFEPLTPEHVLEIARLERPEGVIVQFGGQTPLKIAHALEAGGLRVLGTSIDSIDIAEDRERCSELVAALAPLGLEQPPAALARSREEALVAAERLGYPVLVRPSYVLGGRAMRVVRNATELTRWVGEALVVSEQKPILIDRFLDDAIEVDVDALCDGTDVIIGGIMEHIEEAGIHSGDSACSLPVATLSIAITDRIRTYTRELARRLRVLGLVNLQFAVQGDRVFLLEINPRASRTVPFISKAVGQPLARIAIDLILGRSLKSLGFTEDLDLGLAGFSVKAPVFPFGKFPGVDVLLGPEMRSTGEVMGREATFAGAYAKALIAAGTSVPRVQELKRPGQAHSARAFLSIADENKAEVLPIARGLAGLGFELWATRGTAEFLTRHALTAISINKGFEGGANCVEKIARGEFDLVINTTSSDEKTIADSFSIRRAALERKIPYCTVLSAARAMVQALKQRGLSEPLRLEPLARRRPPTAPEPPISP